MFPKMVDVFEYKAILQAWRLYIDSTAVQVPSSENGWADKIKKEIGIKQNDFVRILRNEESPYRARGKGTKTTQKSGFTRTKFSNPNGVVMIPGEPKINKLTTRAKNTLKHHGYDIDGLSPVGVNFPTQIEFPNLEFPGFMTGLEEKGFSDLPNDVQVAISQKKSVDHSDKITPNNGSRQIGPPPGVKIGFSGSGAYKPDQPVPTIQTSQPIVKGIGNHGLCVLIAGVWYKLGEAVKC